MSSIEIVIVTYNSEKTIQACLDSLKNLDVSITVVDNSSKDKTLEIIKNQASVILIENKENVGFGAANNIGVKNSKSEYILFLNPDSIITVNSIEELQNHLDLNQDVAVVGPKLLNEDGSVQKEMAKFPSLASQILILLRLHRLPFFEQFVYPSFAYEKTQEAEHLMGSALLIRRTIFQKVGGFDEKFFLWFEETDLLKRINEAGYKIVYYPKSVVTHLRGQSTKQLSFWKRQTIWNQSLLYYFKKHKTWLHIIFLLPFILLSYPAAFITSLIKR